MEGILMTDNCLYFILVQDLDKQIIIYYKYCDQEPKQDRQFSDR